MTETANDWRALAASKDTSAYGPQRSGYDYFFGNHRPICFFYFPVFYHLRQSGKCF